MPRAARPRRRGRHDHLHGRRRHHQMGCGACRRHLQGEGEQMTAALTMPKVRGKLTPDAPLAPLVWFKSGGRAEWLFEPKDEDDLTSFLRELDPEIPVTALGLGSNMIVPAGGVPGIAIRPGH